MKKQSIDALALARRIRAAGRPIYIAEDDGEPPCIPSDGLLVRQWAGINDSCAIDRGATAFVIYLVITINLRSFAISAFSLELPWEQESFYWLEDPIEIDGSSQCYRFDDRELPKFERRVVLNHHADVTRIYSVGQSLQGCLLGYGFDPIPDQYPHGTMIPASVTIYDQFGRLYRARVELWTDRSLRRRTVSRKRKLLAHRDPIVQRS